MKDLTSNNHKSSCIHETIIKCFVLKLWSFVVVFAAAGNGNLECLQWLVEMGANSKLLIKMSNILFDIYVSFQ